MKNTNISLKQEEINILKSKKGSKMVSFICDAFDFRQSSYGVVGIQIESNNILLSNLTEAINYFGNIEDIAILKINDNQKLEKSLLENKELICNKVDNTILKIYIVNDMYQIEKEDGIYKINTTKGIIFEFADSYQIGFEKDNAFSEEIIIHKGYDVYSKFIDINDFISEFEKENNPIVKRSIMEL